MPRCNYLQNYNNTAMTIYNTAVITTAVITICNTVITILNRNLSPRILDSIFKLPHYIYDYLLTTKLGLQIVPKNVDSNHAFGMKWNTKDECPK